MKLLRSCPTCSQKIEYKTKVALKNATKRNIECKKCRIGEDKYFRNCPKCSSIMGYTQVTYYKTAVKENSLCRCCKNPKKVSNCIECGVEISYRTYLKKDCNTCKKKLYETRKKELKRSCPQCYKEITYNFKGDYKRGKRKQTLCLTCTRKRTGIMLKGMNLYDKLIKKGLSPKEARLKYEASEKKRLETRKGYKHTLETLNKIKKGGFSKTYTVNNLECQGGFEKKYIENLPLDKVVLLKKPIPLNTPDGQYIGDFIQNNIITEIKSKFTYKIFQKNLLGLDKKESKQRDKVIWISQNTDYQIQLLVIDKQGTMLKEEWYTKDGVEIKFNSLGY